MAKVKNPRSSGSLRKHVLARKRSKPSATEQSAESSKAPKKSASKKKAMALAKEGAPETGVLKGQKKKLKASSTAGAGRPRKRELMQLLTKLTADHDASKETFGAQIKSLVDELARASGRLMRAELNIEKLEERLAERPSPSRRQQHHTVRSQRTDGKNEPLDPLRSRAGPMSDGFNTVPVNADAAHSLSGSGNRPMKP